jgi:hypothetical protein
VKKYCRISGQVLICGHNLCSKCTFKQMDSEIINGLQQIIRKKKIVNLLNSLTNIDENKDGEPEMTTLMRAAISFLKLRSSHKDSQPIANAPNPSSGAVSDLVEVFLGMS